MNGFAVIQQQLLLSFFLVTFSWLKWRTRVLRTIAAAKGPAVARQLAQFHRHREILY